MNTLKLTIAISALALMAACAPVQQQQAEPEGLVCSPAQASDKLVGNWLAVGSEKDVAGAIRTLYTLNADGTMDYIQQVKRAKAPSQGIQESGCWQRNGQTLVLKTDTSNGVLVNLDDPIYTSKYIITKLTATELQLQADSGLIRAKRMSAGYRLPF